MTVADHLFDPHTYACLRCGQTKTDVLDHGLACFSGVVPITHIILRRQIAQAMAEYPAERTIT